MIELRQATNRAHPKRLSLGPRLFARPGTLFDYLRRTVEATPDQACLLLSNNPSLTDDDVAQALVRSSTLAPLKIEKPVSIKVDCEPREFRSEDINFCSGHVATVTVPYDGSAVLWQVELGNDFCAELNGSAGRDTIRIKDVIETLNVGPLRDFVAERLDVIRDRLHHHDPLIRGYNEKLEQIVPEWVASHRATLADWRAGLASSKRKRAGRA